MKLLSALFTALFATVLAPAPLVAQELPRHSQLTEGVLTNGLRYMIQPTKIGGIDFRLLVKAGSFDETEQERGFAHFVEHLAFRQTNKYRDGDINAFIRRLGLNFGQHLNAFTTYDRTGYFLQVPENHRAQAGDEALGILREWAGNIQFPDALVNPERGVVQAEKRVRDQKHEDIDRLRKAFLSQPEYAREVIGTDETLAKATGAGLEGYYRKHYTAERMTVVIAGQLTHDVKYWEEQVRKLFGDLPRGNGTPARPPFDIQDRTRSMAVEYGNAHAVSLSVVQRWSISRDQPALRRDLVNSIANSILTRRLTRSAKAQAGFTSGTASDAVAAFDARSFDLSMGLTGAESIGPGLDLLKAEFGRLLHTPPDEEEMSLAREPMLRDAQNRVAEQDKIQPATVAGTLVSVASYGGYYLDAKQWQELTQALLPGISAKEVSESLATRTVSRDRFLVSSSPKGNGKPPGAEELMREKLVGLGDKPAASQVAAQRPLADLRLLGREPTPGKVLESIALPYDVTEWVLSNGMRVWLKNMALHSNDRIILQMQRRDGLYALPPAEVAAARLAQSGAWTMGGFGELDDEEIPRYFAGKTASMQPTLAETSVGIGASSNGADLELMLQSLHAFITAPRYNQVLLDKLKLTAATSARSAAQQPETKAADAWRIGRIGNWPQMDATPPEGYTSVTTDQLKRLHQRMYGSANGYTVVLTGNLDLVKLRPLVERYLASLPSGGATRVLAPVAWTVNPIESTGVAVQRNDNPAPRTRVVLRYAQGAVPATGRNSVLAYFASQVLSERLRNSLREQAGLAYSPSLSLWVWKPPFKGSVLNVDATVEPVQAARARQIMLDTVADMLARPATPTEMNATIAAYGQSMRDLDRNAGQVAATLARSQVEGEKLSEWLKARDDAAKTTSEELQAFINQTLKGVAPSTLNFGPP
jgi:zinc protease